MAKGDPLTNAQPGTPEYREAQKGWAKVEEWSLKLSNDLYKLYQEIQRRTP